MDRVALSEVGIKLAKELSVLSESYHVKSDAHDILGYEAATVEEEALDLLNRPRVQEYLKESTLLSEWGNTLVRQIPEIAIRVEYFHKQYRRVKKYNEKSF